MFNFIKKFFIFLVVFYIALIVTFPKKEIWFQIENILVKNKIVIAKEKFKNHILGLEVGTASIHKDSLKVADFEYADVSILGFSNSLEILNISLEQFSKYKADTFNLKHSILSPITVSIEAFGTFGIIRGNFDISSGNLDLVIEASKILKSDRMIMKQLKKSKEGNNVYEYHAKF